LAEQRAEEMAAGKPRVGEVYLPSAELSRTSSYSSSRFLEPLLGNRLQRRCAKRNSQCHAYFCKSFQELSAKKLNNL
jgi:hypothetical protein